MLLAQPICQIQHFSIYNGLVQRTVSDIVQDSKGFIWFSTWNGLNRYDGYTFKNYKAYPGDGCTLTSNRILRIVPDQQNNIWCQTYDARVYLFESHQEKFIDILQPFEQKSGETYIVRKIYALSKGVSWIVCDHGAFRVDERKLENEDEGAITPYTPEIGNLPGRKISRIEQDADGDEWIFTDKSVCIVGQKTISDKTHFTSFCENNEKMYLISSKRLAIYNQQNKQVQYEEIPLNYSRLNCMLSLGKDTIGIGTNNGIILFFAKSKQFRNVEMHFNVMRLFEDSHNELWLFSKEQRGIVRYDPLANEQQHYETPTQNMPKAELRSRDVIFEDSQGTLWVVPHLGCLSYYDREDKELKPYYTDYSKPESKFTPVILNFYVDNQKNFWYANNFWMDKISFFPNASQLTTFDSGHETRAIMVDKQQNLWVANKKGVIRIFNPDKTLKGYLTPEGIISPKAISFSRNIYCFTEDEQGNIWMGSKWDGIIRLSPKRDGSFQIRNYVHKEEDPYSLSNNSVYCIYQDSKKRMWIATHGGGINLLQETANGKIRFLHNGNLLKGYSKDKFNKVRVIKEVNNALLVGTTEGLITFSCNFERPEDIKFYDNVRIPDLASSLSSNDVIYIYTDSHKNSYVLTFTGGINQIISDNLLTDHIQFKTYTKRNGLVSDLVLSMIEDQQRNLWVISENTLAKFDPENGTFEHYNEKHLQKEIYFSEASPAILQNQLILGTDAGILKINPTAFSKSSYTPPIVFTSLKIQGVQQQLDLDDLEELKLKPDERNVSFLFAALDYINPTSISYAYRLKGLEEKWNEVENSRTASYINLPPGNYELQIRSTNSDGVWTDNIRKLSVNVTPTFWETSWAILFYIISFILFTSTIVYIILYIYKLRHQIYMEQQLANVKLRFFTDISHELRTPLTLITSPVGEVLEHESLTPSARKLLTVVHNNTERMLRLVNQILDFRKIENKKMKLLLEKTDIVELLQKVMDNFRLIAEEKNINFRLQTDKESIHCWIDQDKVEKIIFNLLSNAFKYTPANKSITVYAHTTKDKVVISVADEGIGIDPKKQQTLFQRFETLVNNNILQPSSGIGLSLVKELIELHQGNIQVNTETGIGSEFIVTLPLDQKVYEGKENAEFILSDIPSTHNQKDSKHKAIFPIPEKKNILQENIAYCDVDDKTDEEFISVLIIEDNTELRSFLNDILSGTYKVIEATNGQEGLEQALQYIPDFIISDVMMPVMDGLDMVKAIKEQRDICHIPIILLSAKSSLDDRISGLEHGIDDYITKPFSSTYLKIRIKYLLQQRKQLQELYLKQWSKTLKKTPVPIADIEPTPPQITSFDEEFMKRVMEIMNNQMDNSDFIIDEFAKKLGMGRTVFYQKLKSLTGLSPIDFVREMRIKRAKQLAESGEYNVSTIAYMTGFNDPKYFSKCFKKRYGVSPSEFQNK
ncbi:response regulator [Bacteroides cellulosilyticus]|uniref:histidine kinase n=1 Tax=Bacteroides cellulosilyticus TaxID=246787 RepID=A0AAW6MC05_9BACE|nr:MULTISPECIES: two-component regulator propeller domain-containing protein [Bacteroides]KAA5426846.1 response regulator [Bacteroides cellulosilyticus]KAA5438839.1 response regulator [Bacteroides cellulosilyticus]KAA5453927.1 response regulator [Bacteroides cellulosilyticus]MCQ4946229.1 response regulator [Bacteroides cellulosilyticus]MCS3054641.1 response regulator [Bacteroides cellulosilyticus]